MNRKRVRVVQGLKIARGLQCLAHALDRPHQHLVTEMFTEQLGLLPHAVFVIVAENIEPARHGLDTRYAFGERIADDFDALARQRIKLFCVIESDPLDDPRKPFGISGGDKAAIPTRGLPGNGPPFDHRDVVPATGERARGPQARETAADDADAGIDVLRQPRSRRARDCGRREEGVGGFADHWVVASIVRLGSDLSSKRRPNLLLI